MFAKTECPIRRSQFRASAKPVEVAIAGNRLAAGVKEFSTGSMGWYLTGKTTIEVDGVLVPVQIGVTLTVIGSKELPPEGQAAA